MNKMGRAFYSWYFIFVVNLAHSYEYTCPDLCICDTNGGNAITSCSGNKLTILPENIYLDVVELILSHNGFTGIPANLEAFTKLERLDLSYNRISALDHNSLNGLASLKVLNLSYNHFTKWGDISAQVLLPATSLETLSLSHNILSGFPDPIGELQSKSLKNLFLVNCSITNIHSDILIGLSNIYSLDLSDNVIDKITVQIQSKSLNALYLRNCGIIKVIDALVDLTSLKELDLSKNTQLKVFFAKSDSLEKLNLSDCDLDSIPKGIMSNLSHAIFRGNHLRQLHANSFENLKKVRKIDLSHNAISTIDVDAFHSTKELVYLDLSYNTISKLNPRTFSSNFKLQTLKMSHNYLREVVHLDSESLRFWDLSSCEIYSISRKSLSLLPLLERIDLAANFLSHIPDNMDGENVVWIDLSFCRIATLNNLTFASMKSLKHLNLRGNRLTSNIRRAFFYNIQYLYLGDNSWRCDCSDNDFRDLYIWLINELQSDVSDLLCQTPEHVEGMRWGRACYERWNIGNAHNDKAWMYSLVFMLTLILLFCVILSIRRAYRLREIRDREVRNQNMAEARERLQRMRIQEREAREEATRNAPDPRELQRPPPYNEAIRMPRLDSSHPSLAGSRGTLAGSRNSLDGSNPDLKSNVKVKRRKRRKSKSASSENLRSTTEQSTSDGEQTLRIYMESDV